MIGFIKGFCRFIVLGVKLIQKTVAKIDQAVFLGHPVAFLFMVKRRLPDQKDNQEKQAKNK